MTSRNMTLPGKLFRHWKLALAVALCPLPVIASPILTTPVRWQSEISIWQRPACALGDACEPPKAVAVVERASLQYRWVNRPGRHLLANREWRQGEWRVSVMVVGVNPPDGQKPYVATQTRLDHRSRGLIAECTRYDDADAFPRFFPPGSCSGRDGRDLVSGVSFAAKY